MNDAFAQRVRAAAVAGWWTILIGGIWLTAAWLFMLGILSAEPQWLLTLWGGHMDWNEVHSVMLNYMAVAKLILLTGLLATAWLTIWSRRLKRMGGS